MNLLLQPRAEVKETEGILVGTNIRRIVLAGILLLLVNSAYLSSFAQASIFYEANVLLHLGLGLLLAIAATFLLRPAKFPP